MKKKAKPKRKNKVDYDLLNTEVVSAPIPRPVYDLRMELLVKALLSIDEILFRYENENEFKASEAA